MVSIRAYERGRDKSFPLNALCRRAAAYQGACQVSWRLRRLRSAWNPVDASSRLFDPPDERKVAAASTPRPPCREPHRVACGPSRTSHSCGLQPESVVLELYSGCAGLSRAVAQTGIRCGLHIDSAGCPQLDLRKRELSELQRLVLSWIASGRVFAVQLGTPCSAWSVARRGVTDERRARAKELAGVELALFSAQVARACARVGAGFSIENPSSSALWRFDSIASLLTLNDAHRVDFDMCRYDPWYRKSTSILTNIPELLLNAKCTADRSHIRLRGTSEAN